MRAREARGARREAWARIVCQPCANAAPRAEIVRRQRRPREHVNVRACSMGGLAPLQCVGRGRGSVSQDYSRW